jgi:RHS repeat-associated protein
MPKDTQPTVMLNLRFPGQYWDDESKLSYNYFRSYQPGQGRYTQFDPIGLAGGWNGYLYAGANPLLFVDPFGLDAQCGGGKRAVPTGQSGVYKCEDDGSDPNAKVCVTPECVAGVLPGPTENRTNEQIECDLNDRNKKNACKKICKSIVSTGLKFPLGPTVVCKIVCPKN